ncbi:hypothetical protein MHU86_18505 [Fragilaria crotonensis]|nr:hypothetical protein MHU86_18505 [Fragilaria crotonensis]
MNKYFTKGIPQNRLPRCSQDFHRSCCIEPNSRDTNAESIYPSPSDLGRSGTCPLAQPIVWRTVDTARRQTHLDQ